MYSLAGVRWSSLAIIRRPKGFEVRNKWRFRLLESKRAEPTSWGKGSNRKQVLERRDQPRALGRNRRYRAIVASARAPREDRIAGVSAVGTPPWELHRQPGLRGRYVMKYIIFYNRLYPTSGSDAYKGVSNNSEADVEENGAEISSSTASMPSYVRH